MKYILTLEKYIGYNDYKKGNWGTPSEIEEDVKSTINLILKPVSDKLKKVEIEENTNEYKNFLLKEWESFPVNFTTSSTKKTGIEDIKEFINEHNIQFKS